MNYYSLEGELGKNPIVKTKIFWYFIQGSPPPIANNDNDTDIYQLRDNHTDILDVLAVAPWNVVGILSCKSFSEKEWFKSESVIVFPDELTSACKRHSQEWYYRGNVQNNPKTAKFPLLDLF